MVQILNSFLLKKIGFCNAKGILNLENLEEHSFEGQKPFQWPICPLFLCGFYCPEIATTGDSLQFPEMGFAWILQDVKVRYWVQSFTKEDVGFYCRCWETQGSISWGNYFNLGWCNILFLVISVNLLVLYCFLLFDLKTVRSVLVWEAVYLWREKIHTI